MEAVARPLRGLPTLLLLLVFVNPAWAQLAEPATVRVVVLSLFHPRMLVLSVRRDSVLRIDDQTSPLNASTPLHIEATELGLTIHSDTPATAAASEALEGKQVVLPAQSFTLQVPGKLTRTYTGELTIHTHHGILEAIVTMPTEQAVASIVAAEAPGGSPDEALKTQAVVSRSFLLAQPARHGVADACDTTHCQFLAAAPLPGSPAARATLATHGEVLTWLASPAAQPAIVPAQYSRSCGGHTRAFTVRAGSYPFYAVRCRFCTQHAERWTRIATPAPRTETERLGWNREHGWSAIPSATFTQAGSTLIGRGSGHGVGLCQLGAQDLARRGKGYEQILGFFFPNTALSVLPESPRHP